MPSSCQVLIDFDGTIATVDTTDQLLMRFADPAWEIVERAWKSGEIGSRECMIRQIDLIRATPAQYAAFLDTIEIDPTFPDFVEFCEDLGLDLLVVSDGLDLTVDRVLRRHGLDLPVAANLLQHVGADRWRLAFPFARSSCRTLAGNCKCAFAERSGVQSRVLIGDGRSDFCASEQVDFVLAKSSLLTYARDRALPHRPFQTFAEAQTLLADWLAERQINVEPAQAVRVDE